jgi:hypothetical protein
MEVANIEESLHKLKAYIEKEEFKGYDSIDVHNTFLPLHLLGKFSMAVISQLNMRLPVNIRPILGIKKEHNAMTMGLLLHAYCILYETNKNESDKKYIDFIFDWLISNSSKGFSGYCWGNNFVWATPDKIIEKDYPNLVTTSIVAKGIIKFYELAKSDKALSILRSVSKYILNDLPRFENNNELCFSYTGMAMESCYNANILGAEVLAKIFSIDEDEELKKNVKKACNFTLNHQQKDGRWNYSIDINTGFERKQIDFHQGYILESLFEIYKISSFKDARILESIKRGIDFYLNKQFLPNGRSFWRYPRLYPIETHHHAVGIIVSSIFSQLNNGYLKQSKLIAKYIINEMQSNAGYFYYRKNWLYVNKISYMRWSNAMMFLALSTLLEMIKKNDC